MLSSSNRKWLLIIAWLGIILATNAVCREEPAPVSAASTFTEVVTVPSAPTGVTATAGTGSIMVSFNPVTGATGYNFYMATVSGVNKTNWSTLPGGVLQYGVANPFTRGGLTAGTTYYLVITALNDAGESVESAQASGMPSTPPTVATPPSASPNPVTGTTTALSVLGADSSDESNLTYTWSTTGTAPASVTYSANGTNAAKNTIATFKKAGSYHFQVMIAHGSGQTAVAPVTVTVNQKLNAVSVFPSAAAVIAAGTRQFTPSAYDQFGVALSSQPSFTCSNSGGGTITNTGLFTAGNALGGPYTVTATTSSRSGYASLTVIAVPIVDFNGDGKPDLFLQNSTSNQAAIWNMNGASLLSGQYVSAPPPAGWRAAAAGDFNGDGKSDLVLQNETSRQIAFWYLNGAVVSGGAYAATTPDVNWRVAAAADMNADGDPDLILQNSTSRQIAIWYMNGPAILSTKVVAVTPGTGWGLCGTGDFNGDGKPDFVLQNATSDQIMLWYMNGATMIGNVNLPVSTPTGWSVVAVGDYNGDGKPDIVLQQASPRRIAFWYMNGTSRLSGQYASVTPAPAWRVAGPK